ncbi:MAG: response regulator [Candidatus Doudnabacteria bacterium]|nr:response regulator [Candidatus Doudnabacteria bacterium]
MYDDMFKKILIIEDDLSYRNPLNDYFSSRGFTISTADDGEMAMEKLLFHRPDLVILDLLLPKVHGFEVLKRIRTYPDEKIAAMPVIILSNLSSEADIKTAEELKISAYFVKSQTSFEDVFKKASEILFKGGKGPVDEVLDFRTPDKN